MTGTGHVLQQQRNEDSVDVFTEDISITEQEIVLDVKKNKKATKDDRRGNKSLSN